jgi:hypothetical protein
MEDTSIPRIAAAHTTYVSVESWTEDAVRAMSTVKISSAPTSGAIGTSVALQIPLDGDEKSKAHAPNGEGISAAEAVRSGYVLRRKTSNRDSLRTREANLKGKDGSRQRRRWENGRVLFQTGCEALYVNLWV